jgi:Tol biopolymer transport system component
VAFASEASDLVAGDRNRVADVFVRFREERRTLRVSVADDGREADGPASQPSISGDCSTVAFTSAAGTLGPCAIAPGATAVFVRELRTERTGCASLGSDGAPANGASARPALSRDGRFVAFQSDATNLVERDVLKDALRQTDVYVRDRVAGTTVLASVDGRGAPGNAPSRTPSISSDGRVVAFASEASN